MSEELLLKRCEKFLFQEARLLDDVRLTVWFDLMSQDIEYVAPIRQAVDNSGGAGFSSHAFYYREDYSSLRMRLKKLASSSSWSENPRTRTRRIVSNIELLASCEAAFGLQVDVVSNLAMFCHRGEIPYPIVVTAERRDRLILSDDKTLLCRREALLDATVLGLEAFSIFL